MMITVKQHRCILMLNVGERSAYKETINCWFIYTLKYGRKVNVYQSRYRPEVAQRVPGS